MAILPYAESRHSIQRHPCHSETDGVLDSVLARYFSHFQKCIGSSRRPLNHGSNLPDAQASQRGVSRLFMLRGLLIIIGYTICSNRDRISSVSSYVTWLI